MTTYINPARVTVSTDRYQVTGLHDQSAAAYLADLAAAQADAAREIIDARAELQANAEHRRLIETTLETATASADAGAAQVRALIRALANRDETEPTETPPGADTARTIYRATFGSSHAYTTPTGASRSGPQIARAFLHLYPWTDATTTDLYRTPRGTRDPDKIAAELTRAKSAARAALAPLTGAAYLAARDIAPTDPAGLLTIDTGAGADWQYPGAYTATVTLSAGPVSLADWRTFDLTYDSPALLTPDHRATLQAMTRGNVPVTQLTRDEPAERDRRMSEIIDTLSGWRAEIIAAYLDSLRTSTRP